MLVIGISGKAGSGKDTIGNYLIKQHRFQRTALADPIRRLVKDVFVVDNHTLLDREAREKTLTNWPKWSVRKLLQFVGTELFRTQIDPDIWVKSLVLRIKESPGRWVVTDVRFPNELEVLKKAFPDSFISIRVERDGCDGNTAGGIVGHASEAYSIDADIVLKNNGTIDDLYQKLDEQVAPLLSRKHKIRISRLISSLVFMLARAVPAVLLLVPVALFELLVSKTQFELVLSLFAWTVDPVITACFPEPEVERINPAQ